MKLICPKCHHSVTVDAQAASVSSVPSGVTCSRCGESLNQLLWSGAQPSSLTTAAAAVVPQSIMENQNAYAPSSEAVFEEVLDIPRPLRNAQPTDEQMLVLEDVIPAEEFFEEEDTLTARLAGEKDAPAGPPQVYGASETSSFDYDSGRAWLRMAPLLLLLGALVFFSLYFLGNRMGSWGGKPQQAASSAPAQPEAQSSVPAAATEKAETKTQSAQPAPSIAVAAAKESPPPQVEQPKAEAAKPESKPAATVTAPTVAVAPVPAPAPVAQQGAGNFTVQVGSYNNSAQAEERAGQLRSNGVDARVVRAEIPHRGTWYRVQTGRFMSRDEAARFASELKSKGAADSVLVTDFQGQ